VHRSPHHDHLSLNGTPPSTLSQVVESNGETHPLIHLEPEPSNPHDHHAILVQWNKRFGGKSLTLGRLARRDAAGLSPLLQAGVVRCTATLRAVLNAEGGVRDWCVEVVICMQLSSLLP
jgi:hypothetical protein